ncbi:hypothetical protein KIN20_024873 [Parelaphostrongylus tenuis]|uniref:Uncharacterized protein n=1 Tax=Parelaphostrongylus tenuis TaxID=148309 RepID=A0AAD5QX02_PARTN|nr:hypothetical protein KIN20_024873 [Parelaphostrongylus tenuis]
MKISLNGDQIELWNSCAERSNTVLDECGTNLRKQKEIRDLTYMFATGFHSELRFMVVLDEIKYWNRTPQFLKRVQLRMLHMRADTLKHSLHNHPSHNYVILRNFIKKPCPATKEFCNMWDQYAPQRPQNVKYGWPTKSAL